MISTSRVSASEATNANARAASSSSSARWAPFTAVTSSIVIVAARFSRRIRQAPEMKPSMRTPPRQMRSGTAIRSMRIRERSSCDRKMLSYVGRKRIGAGTSGSTNSPSSTSNSSRPASSRNVRSRGRSRSTTSRSPVSHDQIRMSETVAGPNAAR